MKLFILTGLFLSTSVSLYSQKATSQQLIREAFSAGQIQEKQADTLLLKLLDGTLPDEFQGDLAVKCGFPIVADLMQKNIRPARRIKKVSAIFYDHVFTAEMGNKTFRITYDTASGSSDRVPPQDFNTNNIPDWVDETAAAFERSYLKEVDTMGYREPLSFSVLGRYDVTIRNLGTNLYGSTNPLQQVTSNPDTYTSEIEVDNDYVGGFYTHGYDALRVTIAHEFHHAIQLSYVFKYDPVDGWFYETTSTWMEDVLYDEVNDYYGYLTAFYNNPNQALTLTNNIHEYGVVVWNHLLEKKYGYSLIRKIWESMPTQSETNPGIVLKATQNVIESESSSDLETTFTDFAEWNYFTRTRFDSVNYFPESRFYPRIKFFLNQPLADETLSDALPPLSARYFNFVATDSTAWQVTFNPESGANLELTTIEYREPGKRFRTRRGDASPFIVDNLQPGDSLLILVYNNGTSSGNSEYVLALTSLDSTVSLPSLADFWLYPSPWNKHQADKMNFRFRLRESAEIRFEVYSIAGKRILSKKYGTFGPGVYENNDELSWDGKNSSGESVPSGVYMYRFYAGRVLRQGKIAIVR